MDLLETRSFVCFIDLDVPALGEHVLLLGLAQLHRHLIAATAQLLVVLVLEGLGAAVSGGLAFLSGAGHPEIQMRLRVVN